MFPWQILSGTDTYEASNCRTTSTEEARAPRHWVSSVQKHWFAYISRLFIQLPGTKMQRKQLPNFLAVYIFT